MKAISFAFVIDVPKPIATYDPLGVVA